MKVTNVYWANYNSQKKIIVNQGGTSSGKTYSILQLLITYAIKERNVITVCAQDIPNIKKGAWRDINNIISDNPELNNYILKKNESDRIIYFINGSIIEFTSFQDAQDAKSGKRDYLFVNEANGITYEIYWELAIRTNKQVFIDYNPTAKFWVHDKLVGNENVDMFISTYKDNPFIPIERGIELEKLKQTDYERWKVYARGLTGKFEGVLFAESETKLFEKVNYLDYVHCQIDPASGGDHAAAIMYGLSNTNVFGLDIVYTREQSNISIDQIYTMISKYRPSTVMCEANMAWRVYFNELKERVERDIAGVRVGAFNAQGNKESRIFHTAPIVRDKFHYLRMELRHKEYMEAMRDRHRYVQMVKNQDDDFVDCESAAASTFKVNGFI